MDPKQTVLQWDKLIDQILAKEPRNPKLSKPQIMAQIDLESEGLNKATSSTGAVGLMQIIPDRYEGGPSWLRPRPTEKPLRNPAVNLSFGIWMMNDAYVRATNKGLNSSQAWDAALTEYYSGSMSNPGIWRPPGGGPSVSEYITAVHKRREAYDRHFFFIFIQKLRSLIGR